MSEIRRYQSVELTPTIKSKIITMLVDHEIDPAGVLVESLFVRTDGIATLDTINGQTINLMLSEATISNLFGDITPRQRKLLELLDLLKGDTGPVGMAGMRGEKGDKGDRGERGPQGPSAGTRWTNPPGHYPPFAPTVTNIVPQDAVIQDELTWDNERGLSALPPQVDFDPNRYTQGE